MAVTVRLRLLAFVAACAFVDGRSSACGDGGEVQLRGRAEVGDRCRSRARAKPGAKWWCPHGCRYVPWSPHCAMNGTLFEPCRSAVRHDCDAPVKLELHGSGHGDVCRQPDGNYECPPDCRKVAWQPYCLQFRHAGRAPRECRSKLRPNYNTRPCASRTSGSTAPCSAVTTLYDLTPGGGERYLLMMAVALQALGHVVDIIVMPTSSCLDAACARRTAETLNVGLDWSRASVRVVDAEHIGHSEQYSVFAFMGNTKVPWIASHGDVGVYMNQFPFDLDDAVDPQHARNLATYDVVMLNSRYSLGWYEKFAAPVLAQLQLDSRPRPTRAVQYPPVHVLPYDVDAAREPWVVLVGRIFDDRQGKHQLEAIEAFERLRSSAQELDDGRKLPELYLVGARLERHEAYFELVRARAEAVEGAHLLPDLPRAELDVILQRASVVWSLTGLRPARRARDPADEEHFGIAVAEAMSCGCVPVLLDRGALSEHLTSSPTQHAAGHLGETLEDVVRLTLRVLRSTPRDELKRMRLQASELARRFSDEEFVQSYGALFASRDKSPELWRDFSAHVRARPPPVQRPWPAMSAAPHAKRFEAVIVEPRRDLLLPLIVRHTSAMLPCHWGVHLVHGSQNAMFARDALRDVRGVRYTQIAARQLDDSSYNALFKSAWFWQLHASFERVLIFQLDSVVLHKGIEPFLKYDYVGAPWTADNDAYVGVNEYGVAIPKLPRSARVGNGGLSLRNPRAMLKILSEHARDSRDDEQEDLFFVRHLTHDSNVGLYNVAPLAIAFRFALEVPIVELTRKFAPGEMYGAHAPFGLHQSWQYTLVPDASRPSGYAVAPPNPQQGHPGAGTKLLADLIVDRPAADFHRGCPLTLRDYQVPKTAFTDARSSSSSSSYSTTYDQTSRSQNLRADRPRRVEREKAVL